MTPQEHAERAFACDRRGEEGAAVGHYRAALAGDLPVALRRECLLGLGSTLRALGRYRESYDVLAQGRAEFPSAAEFPVFQAMAAFNLHRHHEAMTLLLNTVADSVAEPAIAGYAPAIRQYAADLHRIW